MRKLIRTGFTAFIASAFLASGLAAAPSASAEDVPPAEPTYTVTGVTPPSDTFSPSYIAPCAEACIVETGRYPELASDQVTWVPADSGEFAMEAVPAGTYRLAVAYSTLDRAGEHAVKAGYLKRLADGSYTVAGDFTAGTPLTVAAPADGTTTVALGTLVVNKTVAPVTPPPSRPRKPFPTAQVGWSGGSVVGGTAIFFWTAQKVRKGTVIVTKVKGCNGKVVARKRMVRTGKFRYNLPIALSKVGKRASIRIIVSQAKHRTRVFSSTSPRLPGPGC